MKFKITDECGKAFAVEKKDIALPNPRRFKEDPALKSDSCKDADEINFTEDEVKDLKKLAKKVKELLALVKDEDEDKKKDKDEAEEEKDEKEEKISVEEFDADEELLEIPEDDEEQGSDDLEDEEEEVTVAHDSKKSFGAIERKASVDDSIDLETEIAQAWAKRYGGK